MKKILLITCATLSLGCQSIDPYTGEAKTSSATKGAGFGALIGAVTGAIAKDDNREKGALVGAVLGASVGGGIGHYMDLQERELRQVLAGSGVGVQRIGNDIVLVMPGNITFDTNSYHVSAQFFSTLNAVARVIKKYQQTQVAVEGHTDATGSAVYNQDLSEKRAASVAEYMVAQGINSTRISAQGFGLSAPIADNATAQGRQQNRRVEIRLVANPAG